MKDELSQIFAGKKVTLMGLGLLGGAVNDALFLLEHGAELLITDLKSAEELKPSIDKLKKYEKQIKYVLGEHRLEDFQHTDFVLQPGNVPLDSPYLAEAKNNNIPIYVSESLFAKYAPEITLVGVTGTRGKSTTTQLIFEILREVPKVGKKVFLAGNVQNVSTLALLTQVSLGDTVVMELDSWALHGFGDIKRSPNMAVFTTFLPDHLNFYKGDLNLYLRDKANIFLYQKSGDTLILGETLPRILEEQYDLDNLPMKKIIASPADVPTDWQVKLLGKHNRVNIACAVAVARELNIDNDVIKNVVEKFTGVAGRFQKVKEVDGVEIYNDTTATTPDATGAALEALAEAGKRVVLIMGGADKMLNMSKLLEIIPRTCKKVVLLSGSGTDKLIEGVSKKTEHQDDMILKASVCKTLEQAVLEAVRAAAPGDVLLFSPAFASFGIFKNEYDRGEQFMKIVNKL